MFKDILRNSVTTILQWEARLVLKKYRPKIVGVTGSVGKTATKDAIYAVLASRHTTRRSQKSFNHHIGIPLTILGVNNAWWNPLGWLQNMFTGLGLLLFQSPYPEWLVLEVGVEQPGDIKRAVNWINFKVAVLTALPLVPVHVEFFASPDDLLNEKRLLPEAIGAEGKVILNHDDLEVMKSRDKIKAKVTTYGFNEGADVRASNEHVLYNEAGVAIGMSFKIDQGGNSVPFSVRGIVGKHQLYALLAAIAFGVTQNLNLIAIAEALAKWQPPLGRMHLIAGVKNSLIIDDTYNSSPAALAAALLTLESITTTGRKIAVLGDMLELGPHTVDAHRQAGAEVARAADILIAVGMRAKFIAEEAAHKKMNSKKIYHFDDARAAGQALQALIKTGDLILVKGSQGMRLERVVEEIMAAPDQKSSLLVRQEKEWTRKL